MGLYRYLGKLGKLDSVHFPSRDIFYRNYFHSIFRAEITFSSKPRLESFFALQKLQSFFPSLLKIKSRDYHS